MQALTVRTFNSLIRQLLKVFQAPLAYLEI